MYIITVKLHVLFGIELLTKRAFPGGSVVKNLPANAGDTGDSGSIHGSGRSSRGGNGNPLQYSYLENSAGRGAWRATAHGVAELDTTEQLRIHTKCIYKHFFIYSFLN